MGQERWLVDGEVTIYGLICFRVESSINKIYGKPTQTPHLQFANMKF